MLLSGCYTGACSCWDTTLVLALVEMLHWCMLLSGCYTGACSCQDATLVRALVRMLHWCMLLSGCYTGACSCEDATLVRALVKMLHWSTHNTVGTKQNTTLLLDYCKAFNQDDHNIVFRKLKGLDILHLFCLAGLQLSILITTNKSAWAHIYVNGNMFIYQVLLLKNVHTRHSSLHIQNSKVFKFW